MAKDDKKEVIGPVKDRGCTDVVVLILFIAFLACWIGISVMAFIRGNPDKLIYPTNSSGFVCGEDGNVGKTRLIYFDILRCLSLASPLSGCPTPQVCVAECPSENYNPIFAVTEGGMSEAEVKKKMTPYCTMDPERLEELNVTELVRRKICPGWWVKSSDVLGRCLPSIGIGSDFTTASSPNVTASSLSSLDPAISSSSLETTNPSFSPDTTTSLNASVTSSSPNMTATSPSFATSSTVYSSETTNSSSTTVAIASGVTSDNLTRLETTTSNSFVESTTTNTSRKKRATSTNMPSVTELDNARKEAMHKGQSTRGIFARIESDLWKSRYFILACICISFLFAFLWLFVLRYFTGIIVWVSLILYVVLIGLAALFCYLRYSSMKASDTGRSFSFVLLFQTDFLSWPGLFYDFLVTWIILGLIFTIMFIVTVLLLIFLRNRIKIAIEILKMSSAAVTAIKMSIVFPIFPFLLQLFFLFWFVLVAIFLASAGQPEFQADLTECKDFNNSYFCTDSRNKTIKNMEVCEVNTFSCPECSEALCLFYRYGPSSELIAFQVFNFFALLWCQLFAKAICELVLAGTAALGSLIIAIISFIRYVLEYIDYKLKQYDQTNVFVRICLCCCKCCFWLLENFMKFLNRNAYVMTAMYGYNFCTAAKEAFMLLFRNILRVAVLANVTHFVLMVSKFTIMALTVVVAYIILTQTSDSYKFLNGTVGDDLDFYFVPIFVVALGAYFAADVFLEVYEMAIDTIFLCFLQDLEKNDGTKEKPYYMSVGMQEILGKQNKTEKSKKKDESETSPEEDKKKKSKKEDKKEKSKKEDKSEKPKKEDKTAKSKKVDKKEKHKKKKKKRDKDGK